MAMTITTIPNSTAYVKVADDGLYSAIQNIGNKDLWVNIDAGVPVDTAKGFILKPLDTITPTWGDGDVYIRTKIDNGLVAISA